MIRMTLKEGNQNVLRSSKHSIVVAMKRDKQKYRKDGGAMESRENVNVKSKAKLETFRKKSREKENEMNCNQFQSAQLEVGQWSPGQVGPHWGT